MSPVDRYLTALGGAIGGQIPLSERTARLREVRGHLEAAAREVGPEEAIRRFGPVSVVAGDLVRQSRGYTTRSTWALAAFVALLIAGSYIVPALWMSYFSFRSGGWSLNLFGYVLPPLALIAFAARAHRTQRWLLLPVLPALGLAFAAQFPLSLVHVPGPEKSQREALQEDVAYWRQDADRIRRWQSGVVPPDWRPRWQEAESHRLLPFLMLPYRTERTRHIVLEPANGPDPVAWQRDGEAWAAYVADEVRRSEDALQNPPKNWFEEVGFDGGRAIRDWSESMFLGAFVLGATNALALALARRGRRRSGPEWAR